MLQLLTIIALTGSAAMTEGSNGQSTTPVRDRASYISALERLGREFSLDRVAKEHLDVNWKQLQSAATPLSQIIRVQERFHPSQVYVQCDMSIALGLLPGHKAIELELGPGLGFAVGSPSKLPNYNDVTRKLVDGYLPIVQSQWHSGDITLDQTAFAFLPNDDVVVTGKEKQLTMVRMQVTNRSDNTQKTRLLAIVGPKLQGTQTMMYASYLAQSTRWQQTPANLKLANDTLTMDGKVLLTFRADKGTSVTYHPTLANPENGELQPGKFTNCMAFELDLGPKQIRTIDFVMAGGAELCSPAELPAMRKVTFQSALSRVKRHWNAALKPSMKFVTPDQRINDVYRYAILSSLQFMTKTPDRPWRLPTQTPHVQDMTWPWEAATMMTPLMSVGYAKECEPSISYFTERQNFVGKYSENEAIGYQGVPARPAGDLKSFKGAYIGYNPYWMNDTGSTLWMMAEQYRYSRDKDWLECNRAGILAAWEFLASARNQTKILDDKGAKVRYYGLLARGRSHDWEGRRYHFTFTDAFTYLGMAEMAKAFTKAGLPEADRMTKDVADYRQCILDVVQHEQFKDPTTGLMFIPISVFYTDGGENQTGVWNLDGPMWLFYVGLLDASDKRFDDMEAYVDKMFGRWMGICGRMAPGSDIYYVNQSDDAYYNVYLARGEYEKALLVFNSNLAYCMSNDTYQAVERIDAGDPGFCPLQPNASGHGRLIEMMRRMVIDEQDADKGVLWLLRGCARQWFEKGKSITVDHAPTLFGEMSLKTISDGKKVTIDIDCPAKETPKEIRLLIRHPGGKPLGISVNGKAVNLVGEYLALPKPNRHIQVVCSY